MPGLRVSVDLEVTLSNCCQALIKGLSPDQIMAWEILMNLGSYLSDYYQTSIFRTRHQGACQSVRQPHHGKQQRVRSDRKQGDIQYDWKQGDRQYDGKQGIIQYDGKQGDRQSDIGQREIPSDGKQGGL